RGYYYWSLLDNFEWIKGFGPRFGLYRVDYDDFSRTPTESANFYKKLISSHNQGPPTRSLLDLHRADV
ncbi:MAG: family 1 glycosylhydrolase, partial [Bdellovibrionales bacterium]|nr:family 1 glycosylhydrolase [Bdellovibrionales bacterium]